MVCRRICRQLILLAVVGCFAFFGADAPVVAEDAEATADVSANSQGEPIYLFDLSGLNKLELRDASQLRQAWDTLHAAAAIQGIVNRRRATLFLRFIAETDDFWLDELRRSGNWLAGRPVKKIESFAELLATFSPQLKGVVVYKEDVHATSNLASTIAGIEDRVCLRYDDSPGSVYTQVLNSGLPAAENVVRLYNDDGSPKFSGKAGSVIAGTKIPSSGSAKCDAYLWAKHRYLDAGRASRQYMAFYIDSFWLTAPQSNLPYCTLTNHDFFISQRAFFFDLHVWDEEAANDDPGQPPGADADVLRQLLHSMYKHAGGKVFTIGGFTPWLWKYTSHAGPQASQHDGVDTEWKYSQIISAFNGIMDADALGNCAMTNASFYQHFPLKKHYPQNPRPTVADLKRQGYITPGGRAAPYAYVCFYMGDYDSAAWLNEWVPRLWRDPARGKITCSWPFNPNLDRRAPHVLDYVRTHQSRNDWFTAGDSGAGYLNPGMLTSPRPISGLPDGWDAWLEHCLPYFRRYDLSITQFVIDGHSPGMGERGMDYYAKFSPDGLVGHHGIPPVGMHNGEMPYIRMRHDLYGEPPAAGRELAALVESKLPQFMMIRTILKTPTWHKETIEHAQAEERGKPLRFVDPYSFFLLLRAEQEQKNN